MNLLEAFALLGMDPRPALRATMGFGTLEERLAHLDAFHDRVKKQYKVSLAKSHPDRGGDVRRYKAIQLAFEHINAEHEKFRLRVITEWERVQKERAERCFIVLK